MKPGNLNGVNYWFSGFGESRNRRSDPCAGLKGKLKRNCQRNLRDKALEIRSDKRLRKSRPSALQRVTSRAQQVVQRVLPRRTRRPAPIARRRTPQRRPAPAIRTRNNPCARLTGSKRRRCERSLRTARAEYGY